MKFSIVLYDLSDLEKKRNKHNQTDQDHEIRGKERHDKVEWIIQGIGGDEQMDSEDNKKKGSQNEKDLSGPPG